MPKVSVIVTVFERTDFLRFALQSALDQSFQDFEIIVTDDSQSATIREITASFGSEKIRYRVNGSRLGVALNIRAAVADARGDYIAMLNDDDIWEPNFLEKLVPSLDENPQRVLAFSDHWLIDAEGDIQFPETDFNSRHFGRAALPSGEVKDLAALVLVRNGVPLAMAAIFRADAVDWSRVVGEVSGAYDYWISLMLAASGKGAWYVSERLTRYRVHAAMETSRQAPDKQVHLIYIYRTLLAADAFPQHIRKLKAHLATTLYVVGKDCLSFDRTKASRGYLAQSLCIAFKPRTFLFLCLSYCPSSMRSKAITRLEDAVGNR